MSTTFANVLGDGVSISVTKNVSNQITDVSLELGPPIESTSWDSGTPTFYCYMIKSDSSVGETTSGRLSVIGSCSSYLNGRGYEDSSSIPTSGDTATGTTTFSWTGLTLSQSSTQYNYLYFIITDTEQTSVTERDGEECGAIRLGTTSSSEYLLDGTYTSNGAGDPYQIIFYKSRDALAVFNYSLSDGYIGDYYNGNFYERMGINCLLKGTKVLTNEGNKPIEFIKQGDTVLNIDNKERTVKRIIRQQVRVNKSDEKRDLFKDKYCLKENRDLIVSGGHMVKLGNEYHLPINSSKFENIQEDRSVNEFYHIELEEYDYIVAEGIPVESLCTEENLSQKEAYYKERGLSFQDLISSKK
jgi:hypothetical protein